MRTKNPFKRFMAYRRSVREVRLSRSKGGTFAIFLFLALVSFLMAVPFYLAVVQSLKPLEEFFYWPPRFYVENPTFRNYRIMMSLVDNWLVPMSRFLFNSIASASLGVVIITIISCLAAYPMAKGKIPGMKVLTAVVVGTLLFNSNSVSFVQYIIVANMGIVNTFWMLLIPPLTGTMHIFLIRQFIEGTINDEIIEAARIDGASEYSILFRIVMPMIKPAILTMIVYAFPILWSNPNLQGVYSENLRTFPQVLSQIVMGGTARQGPAAAVALIIMLPGLFVFIYSQRSIMQTMTYSGIK